MRAYPVLENVLIAMADKQNLKIEKDTGKNVWKLFREITSRVIRRVCIDVEEKAKLKCNQTPKKESENYDATARREKTMRSCVNEKIEYYPVEAHSEQTQIYGAFHF